MRPIFRRRFAAPVAIAAFAAMSLVPTATSVVPRQSPGTVGGSQAREYVPGEVIVRFKEGVAQAGRIDALNDRGARFLRGLPVPRMQLLSTMAGRSVAQTVASLTADPRVAWAEPNYIRRPALAIDGPRASELWGLENTGQSVEGTIGLPDKDIDVTTAWDISTGHPSVIVAVLDTGIIPSHPDLAAALWTNPGETAGDGIDNDANGIIDDVHGADWTGVTPDGDPTDVGAAAVSSHGTHVSSTIAARGADNLGIVGVAPNVTIMPLRFLAQGIGDVASEVAAIRYANAKGAKVLNGSFGATGFSQAEYDAIAAAPGILFAIAAGNDNLNNDTAVGKSYPCSYDLANIVCVAATNQSDARAPFSNFGATTVDLAAPGVNILGGAAKVEAPLFTDTFESPGGIVGWTTGGTPNTWGLALVGASGSAQSLADSPGGNYAPETNSFARRTQTQDLTGKSGCHLAYDFRIHSEFAFDFLWVESSADGAVWNTHQGWSGDSGGLFVPDVVDMTARDGSPAARFRFAFTSDPTFPGDIERDGVYVDNVTLACLAPASSYSGAADEYAFLDGTSMATPHVAGVAALLLSLDAALTPTQVKARLLGTVDPVQNVTTVTNGRLNADKAVRMAPRAETGLASGTTTSETTLMGMVNPRGQTTTVRFEYGLTQTYEMGQTVPQELFAGRLPQMVTAPITGLQSATAYHFRVVAENASGTTQGADVPVLTRDVPPQPQPTPPPPAALQGQGTPAPSAVPVKKPGPCAKLKGKKKATCIRRQAALRKCAKLKAGPKKKACIIRAKRLR